MLMQVDTVNCKKLYDVYNLNQSDNYKTAEYWAKLHATVLQHDYID